MDIISIVFGVIGVLGTLITVWQAYDARLNANDIRKFKRELYKLEETTDLSALLKETQSISEILTNYCSKSEKSRGVNIEKDIAAMYSEIARIKQYGDRIGISTSDEYYHKMKKILDSVEIDRGGFSTMFDLTNDLVRNIRMNISTRKYGNDKDVK